jgi:hypothetical protein
MTRKYRQREQVWAVVRHDPGSSEPEYSFTVKEIVRDKETAEMEVARLNRLNANKSCVYWATPTRLFPDGTSAGSAPAPRN